MKKKAPIHIIFDQISRKDGKLSLVLLRHFTQLPHATVVRRVYDLKKQGKVVEKQGRYYVVPSNKVKAAKKKHDKRMFQKWLKTGIDRFNVTANEIGALARDYAQARKVNPVFVGEGLSHALYRELLRTFINLAGTHGVSIMHSDYNDLPMEDSAASMMFTFKVPQESWSKIGEIIKIVNESPSLQAEVYTGLKINDIIDITLIIKNS